MNEEYNNYTPNGYTPQEPPEFLPPEPLENVPESAQFHADEPCCPPQYDDFYDPYQMPLPPVALKKKRFGALKITALAVVCALVAGTAGGVTAGLYQTVLSAIESTTNISVESDYAPAEPVQPSVSAPKDIETGTAIVQYDEGELLSPQQVYAQNVGAVVGISATGQSSGYGQTMQYTSTGSGFVISSDGYIITNYHVIDGAVEVQVSFYDGTTYDATIIGGDEANDVALLKVDVEGLQYVTLGNSDILAVGDQVAAIGNPLGSLTFTQTIGYISGVDRSINTDGTVMSMIQTDAAINSGNSGGPLFDMYGNVIGVTTAKYSGTTNSGTSIEGIGFAIPINDVASIVDDLREYGYVTGKAFLGITVQELDSQVSAYYGLPVGIRVNSVMEGSCAETAGMQEGDIILAIDGVETPDYTTLSLQLQEFSAGDATTIDIYRAGSELTLHIVFDEKTPES